MKSNSPSLFSSSLPTFTKSYSKSEIEHEERAYFSAIFSGRLETHCVDEEKFQLALAVRTRNNIGETALHLRVRENNYSQVVILLEAGADVNVLCRLKKSPLHLAAKAGNIELAKLLLDHGARVNILDTGKRSPLYWAAISGHLNMVKFLVENGANLIREETVQHSLLAATRIYGKKDITKYLENCIHEILSEPLSRDEHEFKVFQEQTRFIVKHILSYRRDELKKTILDLQRNIRTKTDFDKCYLINQIENYEAHCIERAKKIKHVPQFDAKKYVNQLYLFANHRHSWRTWGVNGKIPNTSSIEKILEIFDMGYYDL